MQRLQTTPSNRFPLLTLLGVCVLLAGLSACARPERAAQKIEEDRKQVERFDSNLTFQAVTLEEFDQQGRLWWRVNAKQARYSRDNKLADIQAPSGELFQDGKAILKVSAQKGEIRQDGKAILLKGNIRAIDLRDGLELTGDEMEWQPEKETLVVKNSLAGKHPKMTMKAKEGRFLTRARQIDLSGDVTATATQENMQFQGQKISWQIPAEKVLSNQPITFMRTQGNVVDRAQANRGSADLKARTATLQQEAKITLGEQGLQVTSNALTWDLGEQIIRSSNNGIQIINPAQQLTMTASQGILNLKTNVADLTSSVRGVSGQNQAQIRADRLVWNLVTEQFEATGNVAYAQPNPPMNLTGPRAVGGLRDQTVVVSGGRVETSFIP